MAGPLTRTVAIIGGGVAGMTAAQELAERGFGVTVYEATTELGGKARSFGKPGSEVDGRALPGEHGYRFFAGFYRHLPHTLGRIPYDGATVLDNLVETSSVMYAFQGHDPMVLPARFPRAWHDVCDWFNVRALPQMGLSWHEIFQFSKLLLVLFTSCEARRYGQWEHTSWWDFTNASEGHSQAYVSFLVKGLTQRSAATNAEGISARTHGQALLRLLLSAAKPGPGIDRVLNGPTSDVWLDPWRTHLDERCRVTIRTESPIEAIDCSGARIEALQVGGNRPQRVTADLYVAALPVEVMCALSSEPLRAAEPRLACLDSLQTAWMNGIQFYLSRDEPIVDGHVLYCDSELAISSISQQQFWKGFPLRTVGDGSVGGVLSVDICDWTTPITRDGLNLPARRLTSEQVAKEVWSEVNEHLRTLQEPLQRAPAGFFLDPAVDKALAGGKNEQQMFINTVGSWDHRPDAQTNIPNLFLAGDYVRTNTDLASMEAANEAARRAVNAILRAHAPRESRCRIWPMREPSILAPWKALDRWRFARGLPHFLLGR